MESQIDRIKKLLSLANSPNEHEAKAAMAKAQELMLRYNLSMDTIEASRNEYEQQEFKKFSPLHRDEVLVLALIQTHFLVQFVLHTKKFHGTKIAIFGLKENVMIATYMHSYLLRNARRLYRQYQKDTGAKGKAARISWFNGFLRVVGNRLEDEKAKVEGGTALVTAEKANIRKFINQKLGKVGDHNAHMSSSDWEAQQAGMHAGRKVELTKGVTAGRQAARPALPSGS